jgi:hypothetical protein
VYWPGGKRDLGRATKRKLAADLVAVIAERFAVRGQPGALEMSGRDPGSAAAR